VIEYPDLIVYSADEQAADIPTDSRPVLAWSDYPDGSGAWTLRARTAGSGVHGTWLTPSWLMRDTPPDLVLAEAREQHAQGGFTDPDPDSLEARFALPTYPQTPEGAS
jgi:hypothetical protein